MSAEELRKLLRKNRAATSFSKPKMVDLMLAHEFDGEELPAARSRAA